MNYELRIFKFSYWLIGILICLLVTLSGCKSTVYVPVESVRTEYRDRLKRDSVYLHDSVFVERWKSNDTVFLSKEKYRYLYRDQLVRDTVCLTDSIAVPYKVVEAREVKVHPVWLIVLACVGCLSLGVVGWRVYSWVRR